MSSSCQGNFCLFLYFYLFINSLPTMGSLIITLPWPESSMSELGCILEDWNLAQLENHNSSLHVHQGRYYWKIHWNEQVAQFLLLARSFLTSPWHHRDHGSLWFTMVCTLSVLWDLDYLAWSLFSVSESWVVQPPLSILVFILLLLIRNFYYKLCFIRKLYIFVLF